MQKRSCKIQLFNVSLFYSFILLCSFFYLFFVFLGEILDHMPLKQDDINPILLLALHQHFTSKENPFLSYKYDDVSFVEDIINLSLHNDPSEQPRLSNRSFNLTAVNYEDLRLTIAHQYENSMAPNIKKPLLEALAKIQHFTFPDDVIAHYLSRN